MSRRPATVTQADVARIVRAAKQAGAVAVELRLGETLVTVRLDSSTANKIDLVPDAEIVL